jgi:hypothetical protein
MKRLLLALILLGAATALHAKAIQPTVYASQIKMLRTNDKFGDELYFFITEYHPDGRSRQYTVPHYPAHWVSKSLPRMKNIKLWSQPLDEGQSVVVVFELMEQDAPPFDVNESIGSTEIRLANQKGQLTVEWNQLRAGSLMPSDKQVGKQHQNKKNVYTGAGAAYEVDYTVKTSAATSKPVKPNQSKSTRKLVPKSSQQAETPVKNTQQTAVTKTQ